MSLKVVLVDDEDLTIQLLKHLIDWDQYDLTFVGQAHDGEEALRVIEETKPDLVVTDINMPKLSGIDFIKRVKETDQSPLFILISAYNDFHYVQEAMKLGCHDYILKPIDEAELDQALNKVVEKIRGDQHVAALVKNHNEEMKKHYLMNYLYSGLPMDLVMVNEEDYAVDFNHYAVLIFKLQYHSIEEFNKVGHMSQEHVKQIGQLLTQALAGWDHIVFDYHQESWVTIVSGMTPSDMGELSKRLVKQLYNQTEMAFHACFSHIYHTLAELNQGYEEAKCLSRYTMFLDAEAVLGFSYNIDSQQFKALNTQGLLKELKESIEQKSYHHAKKVLEDLFTVSKHINPEALDMIYDTCYQLTTLIQGTLVATEPLEADVERILHTTYDDMKRLTDIKQLQAFMQEMLYVALYDHDHHEERYSKLVRDGIRVIKTKYQENLNLETICDEIAVSKNYFSYLFKREVGMNLWQYLTEYRIKKAKQLLLETDMKSYEIAFHVGYENPSYFSMVFKKYEAMTPNQYRQKNVI
ncbi:hypothetical protein GCM10012290_06780 [Halolactibacillus alkaliphilus]|uniref:DNA-binding response regulator n=1 Tax=Halolactibacillus alkaliphilus TaxID=442899 RepID=A0A511WZQ6_9BACI|nr:response regulator [Halolactibacillus alkaliphilus]GEN56168.1 hypothetical protein HAL01_06320 [Halolactibacillus alkaliphilus]GGN66789.1 hypothetical protein GCM10012290_06780 [Halolactibacillus alkaliphilus]SFO72151.1 two-component system, response regulator YesN [Halolactibacillus alkaliphilus]